MFNLTTAGRLLRWATVSFYLSLSILGAGILLAYGLHAPAMSTEVVGHWFIALGAFGAKTTYIARLAALDELEPHPEGRGRESRTARELAPLRVGALPEPLAERRHSA